MGKKHYTQTDAGVRFISERRPGDVRIPNYVYDMWLPLLGSDAIGIYSVYCRLEREGTVKQLTTTRLTKICRIGKAKLGNINDDLVRCGFIRVVKPTGKKRLMHWTTEITILDPPQFVTQELINEFLPKGGYEILTPWLVKDKEAEPPIEPNGPPGKDEQSAHVEPNGTPSIESLSLNPLDIEAGERQIDTHSLTDLPSAATQAGVLFAGGIEPNGFDPDKVREMQQRVQLRWGKLRGKDVIATCVYLLLATGWEIPSPAQRKRWGNELREHAHERNFSQKELPELYAAAWKILLEGKGTDGKPLTLPPYPSTLTVTMEFIKEKRKAAATTPKVEYELTNK